MLALLETDPNWPSDRGSQNMSRRFVIGMVILAAAIILLGLPLLSIGLSLLAPPPLEYRNMPFKVCAPGATEIADCVQVTENDVFHGGDVVPYIVDRCANEWFTRTSELPYVLSRNVVNNATGTRIILPSLSTEVPTGGCTIALSLANQLPETLAPGRYYLEGVATAYGRWRTANAYFRTEVFTVSARTP